jgi:hypothetical protein
MSCTANPVAKAVGGNRWVADTTLGRRKPKQKHKEHNPCKRHFVTATWNHLEKDTPGYRGKNAVTKRLSVDKGYETNVKVFIRFQTFTVANIHDVIFLFRTSCTLAHGYKRFGGTYCLHIQCRMWKNCSQAGDNIEYCSLF